MVMPGTESVRPRGAARRWQGQKARPANDRPGLALEAIPPRGGLLINHG